MCKKTAIRPLPKFEDIFKRVVKLSEKELEQLWNKTGKRTLFHYNFKWYWSAIENWACIDNSHGEKNFQLDTPFNDYKDDQRSKYWERVAIVIAGEMRLETDMI